MSIKSILSEPSRVPRLLRTKAGDIFYFDTSKIIDGSVIITDSKGNVERNEVAWGMTFDGSGVVISLDDVSWVSKAKVFIKPIHGGKMASTEKIEFIKAELDGLAPLIVDEKKVEFDKGFDEGVKQGTVPGDKIYSQEEMNAELLPRDEKIAAQATQIEADTVMIDALKAKLALVEAEVVTAVATFKADLLAKYTEQQVAETAGEVGFKDLLVPVEV